MNRIFSKRTCLFFGLLSLTFFICGYFYLFRTATQDNPAIGRVTYQWKWGMAREIRVDSTGDGLTDFRGLFPGRSMTFHTHQSWAEAWESSKCDGNFDIHLTADSGGNLSAVEFDSDRDGVFETIVRDQEAEQFLKEIPRAPACKATTGVRP